MDTLVEVLVFSTLCLLAIMMVYSIYSLLKEERRDCKPKQKIHWNAKEGQIKTKDGDCLYDKARRDHYENKISCIENSLYRTKDDTLLHQLQCQAKTGHKMVFEKSTLRKITVESCRIAWYGTPLDPFTFKCNRCGLEITKTEEELKPAEREALKKLGII